MKSVRCSHLKQKYDAQPPAGIKLFPGENIGFHIATDSSCGDGNRRRMESTGFELNFIGIPVATAEPTRAPTTRSPTVEPTESPTTAAPTTASPTNASPTTAEPTTAAPSEAPIGSTLIDCNGDCGCGDEVLCTLKLM